VQKLWRAAKKTTEEEMKLVLTSLFATLGLYVTATEADTLLKTFVPQAEETVAHSSLTFIGESARKYAILDGTATIGDQFVRVVAETPNREAVEVDGLTVRFDNGNSCWQLLDTPTFDPLNIEKC
jgi:sorbitol-specific phosphotransferase system component IIA